MKRIVFLALAVAACSNSQSATDRNRPGTGTSTLLVTADVTASLTSSGPVTNFAVDVRDGLSNKVSGATVVMHNDDFGDVPLVEATAGSGHYVNSKAGFPASDFSLAVTRSPDAVQGVVVGNPQSNVVNAPTLNAVVPANQPMQLSWTTPATAKSVSITTRSFDALAPDTGSYTIPAASNPPMNNQRLILSRYNEVDIAGGLSGSRMRVTFTTTVDPFVVQ